MVLSLEIGEHCEHIAQDAYRCLGRVDRVNEVVAIMLEHRSGLGLVHFKPVANGVEVGVVEPVFAQCPGLKPLDHDVEILAEKIQYTDDIEFVVEELSLSGIAGDSVEQQCVGLGIEDSIADTVLDVVMPEFDGGLVGDKLPFAGVVEEGLAKWVLYLQIAEEITAGDVQIGGDATKDFPLCALAAPGEPNKSIVRSFIAKMGWPGGAWPDFYFARKSTVPISLKEIFCSLPLSSSMCTSVPEMRLMRWPTYSRLPVFRASTISRSAAPSTTLK
ncbi:MAG: hypothetical protein Ct9H300mP32_0750 [Verrucomicrobiota bacterium]|nr:MAG: hypothetical protein Ct9H300mP32_0750 [Verrucomicrobiota bacterium]